VALVGDNPELADTVLGVRPDLTLSASDSASVAFVVVGLSGKSVERLFLAAK